MDMKVYRIDFQTEPAHLHEFNTIYTISKTQSLRQYDKNLMEYVYQIDQFC